MRNFKGSILIFAALFLGGTAAAAQSLIDVAFTTDSATPESGFAATGVGSNDFWNTCTPTLFNGLPRGFGIVPNLLFASGRPSGAGLIVTNVQGGSANAASDPMYSHFLQSVEQAMTLEITNLAPFVYNFYIYGHGNDDQFNGFYQLNVGSETYGSQTTIEGPGYLSPIWQPGVQYVEFTNVFVSAGETVTIIAQPGAVEWSVIAGIQIVPLPSVGSSPVIAIQPMNQLVGEGRPADFSILAVGGLPLEYQWRFDGANISGATNSSYTVTSAGAPNVGSYSVLLSNLFGSVTSSFGVLNVSAPVANLIDVAFTSHPATSKTGFAAIGLPNDDFWNTYVAYSEVLAYLKFVDGSISSAGLVVTNDLSTYSFTASDPMYAFYLVSYGSLTVTVTNLPPGVYNFYLYGHGNEIEQSSSFQLTSGTQSFGTASTIAGLEFLSPIWQEGVQYVEFSNLIVAAGQPVTIDVYGALYGELSGLQMEMFALPPNGAPLLLSVSNQIASVNQALVVTNYAYSSRGLISFTLATNAPPGASITQNGVFGWVPSCEQGSSTNLVTVWATDSGTPPMSSSLTFSVTVSPCVQVSVGSGVAKAGQGTCLPVNLVSTVGVTNLGFVLAYPAGFLTNWNITRSNSLLVSATAQSIDSSHALFNLAVQNGQVLLGANVLGSICFDTLPGASAFVPLSIADMGTEASNNASLTNVTGQLGQVVVVGPQPLLEASLGANSDCLLTLFGNPGVSYNLLTTTNLFDKNSWKPAGSLTLTDLFQVLRLGVPTNQMQFFRAVQP